MGARCIRCGAINPWDPQTEADLFGYWHEQHPASEPGADGIDTEVAMAAYTYAATGWAVFPLWWPVGGVCACPRGNGCESAGKHPLTPHGVKDATTDLATVVMWWRRWPQANIGLPAGANGLAVVDVDDEASFADLRDFMDSEGQPFPDTLTQITGSGKRHFVFAAPPRGIKNDSNTFGLPGIDTRGRGGYIVASPSMHPRGGRYEWVNIFDEPTPWPSLLTALIDPPRVQLSPFDGFDSPNRAAGGGYAEKALENEVRLILDAPRPVGDRPGGRNGALNTAAFNLGTLIGAGLLEESRVRRELYQAATGAGLGTEETTKTIESGIRAGIAKPRQRDK